jgi:hypothetical protein
MRSIDAFYLKMVAKYLSVWFLLALVAIANGVVRQATYGRSVSDLAAHQISTVTAIIASGAVVWVANRFWAIESVSQAWTIGLSWLVMTITFEFGFGHFVAGHSWAKLLADYNILQGRVWSLFLVWITVLPFVVFKVAAR